MCVCVLQNTRKKKNVLRFCEIKKQKKQKKQKKIVPPQGKVSVQFMVGDESITLARNPCNQLPFIHANALNLFRCLTPKIVVTLFNCVMLGMSCMHKLLWFWFCLLVCF